MAPLGYLHVVSAVTVGCSDGFEPDGGEYCSEDAMNLSVTMMEAGLTVIRSKSIKGLDLTMTGIGKSVGSVSFIDSVDSVESHQKPPAERSTVRVPVDGPPPRCPTPTFPAHPCFSRTHPMVPRRRRPNHRRGAAHPLENRYGGLGRLRVGF